MCPSILNIPTSMCGWMLPPSRPWWVSPEYAADQLGELVYIDLPEVGTEVQAGDEVAELESSKAVTPLVAPVAGVIRYVNNEAADDPSIVTGDPYGEGWIFKIELEDDEPGLLSSEEYANIVAQ